MTRAEQRALDYGRGKMKIERSLLRYRDGLPADAKETPACRAAAAFTLWCTGCMKLGLAEPVGFTDRHVELLLNCITAELERPIEPTPACIAYAIRDAEAAARKQALEEAARECIAVHDRHEDNDGVADGAHFCALAIEALAEKP